MTHGDKLTVIDHECAFSFLSSFIPSSRPWTLGAGNYMEQHALCRGLKAISLNWTSCRDTLAQLTGDFFDSVDEALPHEWNGGQDLIAIRRHVETVLQNVDLFQAELLRRIA
jgi:hypothetical protein